MPFMLKCPISHIQSLEISTESYCLQFTGYIVFKREAWGFSSLLFKPARRFSIREAVKTSSLGFNDTRIKNIWAKDHKQQRRVLSVLVALISD